MLLAAEDIDVGPLYVDAMRDAGKIDQSEFSFGMSGFNTRYSWLDIGSPDYSKVAGGENAMVRVSMNEDFFWSQGWQGFSASAEDNMNDSFFMGNTFTIIDTGSSHMFV